MPNYPYRTRGEVVLKIRGDKSGDKSSAYRVTSDKEPHQNQDGAHLDIITEQAADLARGLAAMSLKHPRDKRASRNKAYPPYAFVSGPRSVLWILLSQRMCVLLLEVVKI
ncbi:hypothetical protein WA026_011250 [Henosepilachna vigintioctopunctata]|uniref:Uncharacterized protein n=1 Tax=Henosepilachna vigintioctopunctata TaxID=420089 RepID=A0AAW1U525_9CUCU